MNETKAEHPALRAVRDFMYAVAWAEPKVAPTTGLPREVGAAMLKLRQEALPQLEALLATANAVLDVASDVVDMCIDQEAFEDELELLERWNLVAPSLAAALAKEEA